MPLRASDDKNVIRLLSNEVASSGCPVVIANECPCAQLTVFPALTHNTNCDGEFLRYNRGAFLINNRVDISDASLVHTDDSYRIVKRDLSDTCDKRSLSVPTYEGGEFKVCCKTDAPRPAIALHNANIRFHESAAFTGVDIFSPQ